MEDVTRIPPHSVESEQSILGSILLDKDAIITVSETIRPSDFYKEAHKIIYECMLKLSNKNEPIDLKSSLAFSWDISKILFSALSSTSSTFTEFS